MKEYYSDVRISWGTSFQAENKEDFIIKLKEQFKDDYNIILKDDEIHNVQSAGYIFENIEISFPEGNVAIKSSNCQEYNDCDWVGAFNGDVCVGATQWNTDDCLNGICSISVMGNDFQNTTPDSYMEPGEYPTFKIYDVSENIYYDTMDLDDNYPWGYQAIHAIPLLLGQP